MIRHDVFWWVVRGMVRPVLSHLIPRADVRIDSIEFDLPAYAQWTMYLFQTPST